ncbi:hypothetical protein [Acinetobacter tandoii]|uniref:Uncharacterized protein n=1 Tax=Acinetobacter tandoii DSM 14970 = CIP 107469 TaxID=1120927 RepID=R9B7I0_9GAMM|nr:hypothetical protein [Acinetobacter tandoii]EOR08316.1 hypothetical protein I593_01672 [Acinetobacter tandoii DSM 14970 = CIP 107469]
MKYLVIGALVLVGVLFYFMNQSNKADAERIKQAEIAHQQKIEAAKAAELDKQLGGTAIKEETIKQVVDAKLAENPEITPLQANELNGIILEWKDAAQVASATSRIALSQPVTKMQEIKRNISAKKYQGCAESTRLLYVDAMSTNIDAYLEFMKGKEYELNAATLLTDYGKQLELAEREQSSCKYLQV